MERETYEQLVFPHYPTYREKVKPYSAALFRRLLGLWLDWGKGIPPSKEWAGRGAQNPRLLQAFQMFEHARDRAQKYLRENPPPR